MKQITKTYLLSLLLLCPFSSQAVESLVFSNVWSPEAPPVARVMAGYFTVDNKGTREILIEEVSSPQFNSIEIHRTEHKDGMATMQWQPHIHVPAGKRVELKPGGKHLMMFKPKQPLKQGDTITLHVKLSNNTRQTIHAKVKR